MSQLHRIFSWVAIVSLSLLSLTVHAEETSNIQQSALPQGIVSQAQPWLTHQEWFCTPKTVFNPKDFAANMQAKISTIAQRGWELVAFNQVVIAENSCFVATFKAPKKK